MTKNFLDLHRADELKNFAANNLLSWCLKLRTRILYNWLFTYVGAVHQKGELSLPNKSNWVLG